MHGRSTHSVPILPPKGMTVGDPGAFIAAWGHGVSIVRDDIRMGNPQECN